MSVGCPDTIKAVLDQRSVFQVCSGGFVQSLAEQGRVMALRKGQVLLTSGGEASRFYIVLNGWVKLYRETLDGAQAVVDILTAGHMFGEVAVFEGDIYPYSAEAAETAQLVSLPLDALKAEMEGNPRLAMAMMRSMASGRKRQDEELEHRTLQNAPQRIGCFLLRLADQNAEGAVDIHLPYDKTLVASRLGMQPETFSRALAKLKKETGLRVKGATISLDSLDQLVRYSCSACSNEFPCSDLKSC